MPGDITPRVPEVPDTPEAPPSKEEQRQRALDKLAQKDTYLPWIEENVQKENGVQTVTQQLQTWAERNCPNLRVRDQFYMRLFAQLTARSQEPDAPPALRQLVGQIENLRNAPLTGTNARQKEVHDAYTHERVAAWQKWRATTFEGATAGVGPTHMRPVAPDDGPLEDWQLLSQTLPDMQKRGGQNEAVLESRQEAGTMLANFVKDLANGRWQTQLRSEQNDPVRIADRLNVFTTMVAPLLEGRVPAILGSKVTWQQWKTDQGISDQTLAIARQNFNQMRQEYTRAAQLARTDDQAARRSERATTRIEDQMAFEKWLRTSPDLATRSLTSFKRYANNRPRGPAPGDVAAR